MSDVTVISKTQEIIVDMITQDISVGPAAASVSVINAGPQGPPGQKGEPGAAGGAALNFQQVGLSDEWVINHNFGFYPNVDIYTVGGLSMWGQVVNTTINQVRIYFTTPVAGSARLT